MKSKAFLSTTCIWATIGAVLACSTSAFGGTLAEQNFIDSVYQDLLHRPADPAGVAFFLSLFDNGGTGFDVAHTLDTNQTYYTDLLGSYYQGYLNRPLDPGSIIFYKNLRMDGGTDLDVEADILGSSEYFTSRGAGDNSDFLNALYQDLLSRPADPGAMATYLPLLNASTPRSQVAASVLNSSEYDTGLVNGYFLRFLGRPAGSDGAFYVSELGSGFTDETVIAQILGTQEFFALAQTPAATPEPGTFLPIVAGLGFVLALRRHRTRGADTRVCRVDNHVDAFRSGPSACGRGGIASPSNPALPAEWEIVRRESVETILAAADKSVRATCSPYFMEPCTLAAPARVG